MDMPSVGPCGCDRRDDPNCCYKFCWTLCGVCAVYNWDFDHVKQQQIYSTDFWVMLAATLIMFALNVPAMATAKPGQANIFGILQNLVVVFGWIWMCAVWKPQKPTPNLMGRPVVGQPMAPGAMGMPQKPGQGMPMPMPGYGAVPAPQGMQVQVGVTHVSPDQMGYPSAPRQ